MAMGRNLVYQPWTEVMKTTLFRLWSVASSEAQIQHPHCTCSNQTRLISHIKLIANYLTETDWLCEMSMYICDWVCENQSSDCKTSLFFYLLYHNLITIYTIATKFSSLLQNLMSFLLQLMEMGYYILSGRC